MAKRDTRASITGTYKFNADELIQFTVTVPNAYPDAIAEAKATVLAMMHAELADVMEQTVIVEPETS